MDRDGFKAWLLKKGDLKPTLVKDAVSRAKRVEDAFRAIDPSFSFEGEYARDEGKSFISLISRRGVTIQSEIDLPIGTNQMDSIASAAKKYMLARLTMPTFSPGRMPIARQQT